MSTPTPVGNPIYSLLPTEVEGFGPLAELALDMRWSWSHYADDVWRQLDPALWELTQNPWAVLQSVSRDKLRHMLADPAFREKVDALVQTSRQAAEAPAWFQQTHAQSPLTCVAYFSMEFMLSEALPIYSGGLGNVAGDQLKAASDLGVPVVAVGLLYQQGYFRQVIGKDGAQQALFPYNDPGQLPITPLRQPSGEWLRLELDLPGYPVWLRVWQVQVGRIKLYLLDSNDLANFPAHRGITSELYGGGPELRLQQEMVLGIGGWRLLHALGIQPEVCHLNEGHAAFAVLERARNDAGQHVVLSHNAEMVLVDPKGREMDKYDVPRGAILAVAEDQEVMPGALLCQWDPHALPVLAEVSGKVRFLDIIDGETMNVEKDPSTGRERTLITESKGDLHPQIILEDETGKTLEVYYLRDKTQIEVTDGKTVTLGTMLARTPREAAGTQDITGGLPRVTEIFEARKPKDPAVIAEIDGTVEIPEEKRRGKRTITSAFFVGIGRRGVVVETPCVGITTCECR